MRLKIWLILILLLAAFHPSKSAVLIIPVPELEDAYFGPSGLTRSAEFFLPSNPVIIELVSIAIWGKLQPGEANCGYGVVDYGMDYSVYMVDSLTGGMWTTHLYSNPFPGDFFDRSGFTAQHNASWDCLMDGQGEVTIYGYPDDAFGGCTIHTYPLTALDSVRIYISGEFSTPVEQTTWGRIRALYR